MQKLLSTDNVSANGQLTTNQLTTNQLTTNQLTTNQLTTNQLTTNQLTTNQITAEANQAVNQMMARLMTQLATIPIAQLIAEFQPPAEGLNPNKVITPYLLPMPKDYRYFKSNPNADSIESDINKGILRLDDKTVIIKTSENHRYQLFANYNHFNAYYPAGTLHCCDEVILGWRKQRPKYDIDNYKDEEQFNTIYNAIELYFKSKLKLAYPCAVVCDSSGLLPDGGYKNSAHIIVNNYAFRNAQDAATVSGHIYDSLPVEHQYAFDQGVNKSIQHFRTPLSSKGGRMLSIPWTYDREALMISTCANTELITMGKTPCKGRRGTGNQPAGNGNQPAGNGNQPDGNGNQPDGNQFGSGPGSSPVAADIATILAQFAQHLVGWNYRTRQANTLIFNRTPAAATQCDLCHREHTADNTLRLIIKPLGIYLKCIKGPNERLLLATPAIDRLAQAVAGIYEAKDIAADFLIADVHDNPTVKPFELHKTLYIKANMKMGKTNAAIEYCGQHKNIVIVSFRKTFTQDKLAAFKDLGFRSYLDLFIPHSISLADFPRIIVQVESLHRITFDQKPDLLLLDESEAIFDQFLSSTIKTPGPCIAMFNWLLTHSAHCLAMDANLCDRTVDIIRSVRGVVDEMMVVNLCRNMLGDTISITESKEVITQNILKAATDGMNIVIPTNSKSFAKTIHKLLCTKIDPGRVLLITSETDDAAKARIFADINAQWKNYQVVIYTPTCSAGISFTEKHFETCFGYFTTLSTAVESWRQSMYRVRDVGSLNYQVCIKVASERLCHASVLETREYMRNARHMESIDVPLLSYTFDEAGFIDFDDSLIFRIVSWGLFIRNQSLSKPLETFVGQCTHTGALVKVLVQVADKAIEEMYVEAAKTIVLEDFEKIIVCADISETEFELLKGKLVKTVEESTCMTRFSLRKTYRWPGPITLPFMKTYANNRTIKNYRNLTDILRHNDTLTALAETRVATEGEIIMSDRYTKQKVAVDLLLACGFTGILDVGEVSRVTLDANIVIHKPAIILQMNMIRNMFIKKELVIWKVKPVLDWINGILDSVYGCTIVAKSRARGNRDRFIIKHEVYGILISKLPDESRPFIVPHWKHRVIINDAVDLLNI